MYIESGLEQNATREENRPSESAGLLRRGVTQLSAHDHASGDSQARLRANQMSSVSRGVCAAQARMTNTIIV
jgi:hypothetical protein